MRIAPSPAGLLRERIFRSALMYNGVSPLPHPFFAFSDKKTSLVLLQDLAVATLNAEKLGQNFQQFMTTASTWHEALTTGRYQLIEPVSTEKGSGFFGLKP